MRLGMLGMRLVIITGLSGSGKSVALRTLEDEGFYCTDNLPVGLLPEFVQQLTDTHMGPPQNAAVSIDARNKAKALKRMPQMLESIHALDLECDILFLEADDGALLKRFSETRRRHPLTDSKLPLHEALRQERHLLESVYPLGTVHIDTSRLHMYQLRDLVRERILGKKNSSLSLLFESFGFRHGLPKDADFVFDVRCLPNPYWDPALRPLTGLDPPVDHFLGQEPLVAEMYRSIRGFVENWIPRFEEDNRSYLTVAIGCTGGRHRSVYLSKRLGEHFRKVHNNVLIRHRDLS
jgi:UPF0042 nucleotide-binding protein